MSYIYHIFADKSTVTSKIDIKKELFGKEQLFFGDQKYTSMMKKNTTTSTMG